MTRRKPEQIVQWLHEADGEFAKGKAIEDICRDKGISPATYHRWKQKYGGLSVQGAKRLKALEIENAKLNLLIIAPSDEPRWLRAIPVYRALAGLGIPKDIVWWTPEEIAEWQGVKSHFINTVLREGKVLYENPS